MVELVIFHRRSKRTSRAAFRDHWRGRRADVVAASKSALAYKSYAQLHRTSRLNPIYLAMALSRTWPIVAFFSALNGLPIPSLKRTATHGDERWDAVEIFHYESREALEAALTSPKCTAAIARLAADALGLTRYSAAMVAERHTAYDATADGAPTAITLYCLRARPFMTRTVMLEDWSLHHKKLAVSLQQPLAYSRYDQLYAAQTTTALKTALAGLDPPATDYDGIAVLGYAGQKTLLLRLFNPATLIANFRLINDEVNFIDHRNSALVFGSDSSAMTVRPERRGTHE